MKLVKLNTDHYIIVDNSEIKEGDWMIRDGEQPTLVTPNFWWDFGVPYKKITHSTQPLDSKGYWGKVMPLTLTIPEIKELIGEVEKKAEEVFPIISGAHPNINWDRANLQEGFVTGYTQALEDNKEKKYTEEDLFNAIGVAIGLWSPTYASFEEGWKLKILQSLQPKTEWEVEFDEQGQLRLL